MCTVLRVDSLVRYRSKCQLWCLLWNRYRSECKRESRGGWLGMVDITTHPSALWRGNFASALENADHLGRSRGIDGTYMMVYVREVTD